MAKTLNTTFHTRSLAGDPPATIRVSNIQTIISGPQDAWGRPGRPQPLSVSVEIFLARPFDLTSTQDAVEDDTVHYGLLSKKIQSELDATQETSSNDLSLSSLTRTLWERIAGIHIFDPSRTHDTSTGFLKPGSFRYLMLTVKLPKASSVGDGVSMVSSVRMGAASGDSPYSSLEANATMLKIHDLRVPILIGVNSNERERKQTVIANIEIEKWLGADDEYCSIEAVVTKVMEESAFGTLETLLHAIASKVVLYLNKAHPEQADYGWKLKISLEKPIAVPFADAPCVELSIDSRDVRAVTD